MRFDALIPVTVNNNRLSGKALRQWLTDNDFVLEERYQRPASIQHVFYREQVAGQRRNVEDASKVNARVRECMEASELSALKTALDDARRKVPLYSKHHWLTFETLFNAQAYKQANQELPYGLYTVPVEFLNVDIVPNPTPALKAVLKHLFPCAHRKVNPFDLDTHATGKHTGAQEVGAAALLIALNDKANGVPASRGATVVNHVENLAVLPYNYQHNSPSSQAIGTTLVPPFGIKRLHRDQEWAMWNTASRSKIATITATDLSKADPNPGQWDHAYDMKASRARKGRPLTADELEGKGGKHFDLANLSDSTFSVKTGVQYIGQAYQGLGSSQKDKLEGNFYIARYRSDLILELEQGKPPDPDFVLQHEVMTVTLKTSVNYSDYQGNGYSVRDLSDLKKDKIYMPTLSIPYAGPALVAEYNEKNGKKETFSSYWGKAYAQKLGRVKAKLLLRYGIQFITPNPQNFMLEFNADLSPTGRLIVRDIGDANLHTQIIAAIHGDGAGHFKHPIIEREYHPPGFTDAEVENIATTLKIPIAISNPQRAQDIKNAREMLHCQTVPPPDDTETGKDGGDYATKYPRGTQFQWHNYSTFKGQYLDADCLRFCNEPVLLQWGKLHDDAYVGFVHEAMPSLDLSSVLDYDYTRTHPTVSAENRTETARRHEMDRVKKLHDILVANPAEIKKCNKHLLG